MKLSIAHHDLVQLVKGERIGEMNDSSNKPMVKNCVFDSRRVVNAQESVFFALKGIGNDGHNYLVDAYSKGIRTFIVSQRIDDSLLKDATVILVDDTLKALFRLAQFHRSSFQGQLIAISGKIGKTSVKEWLYYLVSPEVTVSRSPKSYNSNLGIALSLLEMNPHSQFAFIEVKPHEELDPVFINEILQPDFGILTASEAVGSSYSDAYFEQLFKGVKTLFHAERGRTFVKLKSAIHFVNPLKETVFQSESKRKNVALALAVAQKIGLSEVKLKHKLQNLPDLALRMETFEGKDGNFIINDLYNLDLDAFKNSLEFQKAISNTKKRVVILGLGTENQSKFADYEALIQSFGITEYYLLQESAHFDVVLKDSVILIKGSTSKKLLRIANQLKEKRHHTHLRVNLKSLRKNIIAHRQHLPEGTKLMAMMKASGYGSGLDKMVQFVDSYGVDYFGVAFVDEGVAIRNAGIQKPIMVMNTEEFNYEACIQHQLEPSIFDLQQLDEFISECIYQGIEQYPIHLKIDTGMHRLGFEWEQLDQVLEIIQSQPEIRIKSVYSHLADADNARDKRFTEHQIQLFSRVIAKIQSVVAYPFEQHILNTPGIENYANVHFSMARLGIGMYGVSSNAVFKRKLEPVISWYSVVSQVRKVIAGQSVGYSRTHFCKEDTIVATIPVGYADGLRRSLSNGVGYLTINGTKCPIIGRVCMDMVMVDATKARVKVGDEVEIIGPNCSLEKMAELMQTIPYEVMTSISERVHKIYIE